MIDHVWVRRRKRIHGGMIWVSTGGAGPIIQQFRIGDSLYGPINTWSTTNSTTRCDGVCTDGRNVYVLHDLGTTYQFDVYRPSGQFIYTSGTFAGTSFVNAVGLDYDGRNILVFYRTSETNRNLRMAIHRPIGTLIRDLQVLRGSSLGDFHAGCWDGNGLWALSSSGAVGAAYVMRRFRWDAFNADTETIYDYNTAGTATKTRLAHNGRDLYGIRANDTLTKYRNPASAENNLAYSFGGTKTAIGFI
jgi:hypothetical protein